MALEYKDEYYKHSIKGVHRQKLSENHPFLCTRNYNLADEYESLRKNMDLPIYEILTTHVKFEMRQPALSNSEF